MLNNNTLSQLKQLKQQIEDQKEYAVGIIKGTQRKFGFVVLDDGREIFLNPEAMQKVFPGDKVKVLIVEPSNDKKSGNKAGKKSGLLEKIIDSPLKEFAGRYVVRGKGHFVEPDIPRINRLIFIPPAARNNAKPGDYIYCRITRHPYPEAKPQAKILSVIGAQDQIGVEADYMISKFQLAHPWPNNWQQQLTQIDPTTREDLSQHNFITIDNANTLDMDDALCAQANNDGWKLQVAIADPCALIPKDCELDKVIYQRATSSYLPGKTVTMMPAELSQDLCSLLPEQQRPALVCSMDINPRGEIVGYQIIEALISSKAKLSYEQVNDHITNPSTQTNTHSSDTDELLNTLYEITSVLHTQRKNDHLVIPSRQEFNLVLNDHKKIGHIELQEKNNAHRIVEECMVAANRCAADMLGDSGLFISHPGFRKERLPDVKKLAEEQIQLTELDFSTLENYRQLMNSINDEALEFPLRAVLSRLLERSQLSETPKPHYGMGLTTYTTFTSPIRKYNDLIVHRMLKAKINQQDDFTFSASDLANIQASLNNSRQARFQMEQWLKCQYAESFKEKTFEGTVMQINSNGFSVMLDDNYIDGFVETRALEEKYSFDPMRLTLKSKTETIELNKKVNVEIKEIDYNQRTIRLHFLPSIQ